MAKAKLSNKIIRSFINEKPIKTIEELSGRFNINNMEKTDWMLVAVNHKLSMPFIKQHQYNMHIEHLMNYQKLSEKFIEDNVGRMTPECWIAISKNQKLSGKFIRKHLKKLDPENLAIYQKLPEDIIEEIFYLVPARYVCMYQNISYDFIKKHIDDIDTYAIYVNPYFNEEKIQNTELLKKMI